MSILTVDRFGQLIQKIPAMIPKMVFNNKTIVESPYHEHEVIIVIEDKFCLSCFDDEQVKVTDRYDSITFQPPVMERRYAHIEFHHLARYMKRPVEQVVSEIRAVPHVTAFLNRKVTNYGVSVWARYPRDSEKGFGTFSTIRWYVPYQLVPFFVGVTAENCKIIRDIPDIVILAGWLEDHSENSFDSIKAENFREGVRLLQTAMLPKTNLEKRLSNASS